MVVVSKCNGGTNTAFYSAGQKLGWWLRRVVVELTNSFLVNKSVDF